MDATKAAGANEDDLVESWFEQGELGVLSEAALPPHEERTERRARVGVVVAAISATALTLVLVFVGHV
jgi:hypothetical protein